MWVFTSLGYGKQYLNRGSRILTYANTAVYPFYILHQTVIVIIAFYVVQTNDEASLKFLFLLFACFFITILIYHLFIRPFNIMRFLFGMKYSNLFFSVSLLLSLLLISCGTTNDAQKSSATVEATHEKTVEATVYDNTQASWEYLFSKVPGVDYTRGGLKIRGGSNSIGGGSDDPLIVVDGTVGSLEGLNPTDVDRIRVLKGPQAAIYGSRAAAGVIEITTKKQ
jgi:TonB-dependent SusC/RagA subfamily outer membrane receptor